MATADAAPDAALTPDPADPTTLALRLATLELAVLPVLADKRPAKGWGVTSATADPQVIVDAFVATGAPLVGVAMGASGLLAVDIDRHPGGADGFASLAELGAEAPLPATVSHASLSGAGAHHLYSATPNAAPHVAAPGVDVKAGAAYVVWPGSAPVPEARSSFTPAPDWVIRHRGSIASSMPASADITAWLAANGGEPDGAVAFALAALPEHGDPRWNNAALVGLALPVVRAARDSHGGAAARELFAGRYSAGNWDTPAHRTAALRAFDAAVALTGAERSLADAPALAWAGLGLPGGPDVVAAAEAIVAAAAGATGAGEAPPFRVLTRSDLRNRPRPPWLIDGLVQGAGVVVLAGEGGIGKSFVALDWCARVATGAEWFGHRVRAGRALYVAAEGIEFFDERLSAWEAHNALQVPDDRLRYVESGFNLSDGRAVAYAREIVARDEIDLVVVDTLSQLSAVESENDNAQLAAVMRAARHIREARPGATVLIVHHVGKGERGRVRGASAIRDNADAVIVARHRGGDTFALTTRAEDDGKQKNATATVVSGLYLRDVGGSAAVEQEGAVDLDGAAISEALADGESHPIGDVLARRGDASEAARKRLVRQLDSLVAAGSIERSGATRGTRYRLADGADDGLLERIRARY
ncbi:AAA family ATPase [uncultured Microbacterium sp.]|nr:AAA family ATPase [uncultured Microbacterium sp.]